MYHFDIAIIILQWFTSLFLATVAIDYFKAIPWTTNIEISQSFKINKKKEKKLTVQINFGLIDVLTKLEMEYF